MLFKIPQKWCLLTLSWLVAQTIVLHASLSAASAAPVKFKMPAPPPQRGIPGNRTSAASRDNCPTVDRPLTALVPEYRANPVDSPKGTLSERVWGLTSMERPTLLFYIPYTKATVKDISFTLQDESDPADPKIVPQEFTIAPPQTPGIVKVTLPKSSQALAPNRVYHWFLKLNMDCRKGQRPIFVDGWIQRAPVDRAFIGRIDRANPTARVALYAENGLWYDAIATLATMRAAKPQDATLTQDWQSLLDSIELGNLADRPIY